MTDTVRLIAALHGKANDADGYADNYKGQRLETWMRGFAHTARLAITVLEKCPKVVDLGDDAALSAPGRAGHDTMREALARQVANAGPGHDSLGSFGPDGLVVYLSPEQRDMIVADLQGGEETPEEVERWKENFERHAPAFGKAMHPLAQGGEVVTSEWQFVPKVPTPEMLEAGWMAQPAGPCCDWDMAGIWNYMLSAAPPPPATGEDRVEEIADAIDETRYRHPELPRPRPRPFAEADRSDREYALRLARAVLAVINSQ